MADDTRPSSGVQTTQIDSLPPRPRAPANSMPGGTAHTAGGEKLDNDGPSYIDAVRSLGPEYYLNFHKRPCVRDSQLQGLAAGFAGGSIAAIIGSASLLSLFPAMLSPILSRFVVDSADNSPNRACLDILQLGCSNLVWCKRRILPSLPILPIKREGRNQASAGLDGEEASKYRGEERGETAAERGV